MTLRVFVPRGAGSPTLGAGVELDDEESRYLIKVRRVRLGAEVELLDGEGGVWSTRVVALGRRATLEVAAATHRPDPTWERVLLLGMPDPPALAEALTGASELGASEVVLVECTRSQGHLPSPARIERVLQASQRQCGRPRRPSLHGPWSLARALEHRRELPGWFAWERAAGSDATPPTSAPEHLRLLVGPEGGFADDEVRAIEAAGLVPISLGPWILRTPTAVVAILARALGPCS